MWRQTLLQGPGGWGVEPDRKGPHEQVPFKHFPSCPFAASPGIEVPPLDISALLPALGSFRTPRTAICTRDRTGQAGRNRAGQGRAGQNRAGQGRAGQNRAGQGRAGQNRAGQGRAGRNRAGQGQGRAGRNRAEQDRAVQGRAGQGRAGQDRAGQERAGRVEGAQRQCKKTAICRRGTGGAGFRGLRRRGCLPVSLGA